MTTDAKAPVRRTIRTFKVTLDAPDWLQDHYQLPEDVSEVRGRLADMATKAWEDHVMRPADLSRLESARRSAQRRLVELNERIAELEEAGGSVEELEAMSDEELETHVAGGGSQ